MVEWKIEKFKDYVDLLAGFAFKSKFFTNNKKDIPLVKGENVHQGYIDWENAKRWKSSEFETLKKFSLEIGDVVLAMDRPWIEAGLKYAWIKSTDPKALLVQRVARLRGKNGLITNYLRYLIGSSSFTNYIKPVVTGVNVPHISGDQIKDFIFLLPPVENQQKIVSILSAYDDLIENNLKRIKILEEMVQMIYREWFVNFRFPGHEKVKMVKSELGMIPEGWKVRTIKDIVDLNRGRSYKGTELVEEGGLPFLNLKCLKRDGGFRYDGLKRYSGPFKDTQTAIAGDVIIALTDMTQERRIIARAARVPDRCEHIFIYSMDLVKLTSKIQKEYLYSLLRFSDFPDKVKQYANGANVLHLNPSHINEFQFVLPPISLRSFYEQNCSSFFGIIDMLEAKNYNLRKTRDLLLPKLISGELDVDPLNINTESLN